VVVIFMIGKLIWGEGRDSREKTQRRRRRVEEQRREGGRDWASCLLKSVLEGRGVMVVHYSREETSFGIKAIGDEEAGRLTREERRPGAREEAGTSKPLSVGKRTVWRGSWFVEGVTR
jgi:hypothetical protein